jgi:hypothetical protein
MTWVWPSAGFGPVISTLALHPIPIIGPRSGDVLSITAESLGTPAGFQLLAVHQSTPGPFHVAAGALDIIAHTTTTTKIAAFFVLHITYTSLKKTVTPFTGSYLFMLRFQRRP